MSSRGRIATMLVALAACPCAALGSVIVSLNNPGSTTLHEVWVQPGETFSIDVNLDTDISLFTVGLRIGASASNVFDVLQATVRPPWNQAGNYIVGGVDPVSGSYAVILSPPNLFGPGVSTLATLQVAVDASAPETDYRLGIAVAEFVDRWTTPESQPATGGPGFLVHVVPEPASLLLLLPAFFFVRRLR